MLSKKKRNFTEGPLFSQIFLFALPIMLTGILQITYSIADNVIVSWSTDPSALSAVGSTTSLNNLTLHLLLGLSVGSSVVVARAFGAKNDREVSRTVHTAMTVALFGGILFMLIGLIASRPVLTLIGTNENLLDNAVLYYRIICLGLPASALYNFGAAILRSTGDSKTPLVILSSSGLINVLFNLFFVMCCNMTVDGVAIATIISQYISAVCVILVLIKRKNECYGLSREKYCFDFDQFKKILRFGIPAGIQSSMFGISNVLLTGGMNSFGIEAYLGAYTITNQVDALTYTVCSSFSSAALTAAGQNYGAKQLPRIKKTVFYSLIQTVFFGLFVGLLELLFLDDIVNVYLMFSDYSPEIKQQMLGVVREICSLLLVTYFLCGIMEVFSATARSLGYAFTAMTISLFGICGLRVIWVSFVFPIDYFHTPRGLLTSYPVTWSTTALALLVLVIIAWLKTKALFSKDKPRDTAESIK